MFEIGDKVVCINNCKNEKRLKPIYLTLYKTYTVLEYNQFLAHVDDYIHILDDKHQEVFCNSSNFISIEKDRRRKLNKIISKI